MEERIKLELVYFIDDDTATVASTGAVARSRFDPEIIFVAILGIFSEFRI